MKKLKFIWAVLAIAILTSMISACTIQNTGSSEATTTAKGTTSSAGTSSEKVIENFKPTGYPIVSEKITLKVMGKHNVGMLDNWNDIAFFKYMEEITNIHLEFDVLVDEAFEQKRSLAFASGDLPDLFFKCAFKMADEQKYGSQGLIVPLNDLIDEYAPSIKECFEKYPLTLQETQHLSGDIYSLPYIGQQSSYPAYFINEKWIKDLGMTMPDNLDDYYKVLKAFKENDLNGNGELDEIPMTGAVTNTDQTSLLDFVQNFGLLFGSGAAARFFVDDGVVKYSPVQPEYKQAMIYLNRLFEEDLLDNNIFTQDNAQVKAKGQAHQIGVVNCWAGYTRVGNDLDHEYVALEPFEANGKKVWHGNTGIGRGYCAITNKNKYPEATIRWLDYLYTEEGSILAKAGKEGVDWDWNDDGTWLPKLNEGETEVQWNGRVNLINGGEAPYLYNTKFAMKYKLLPIDIHYWESRDRLDKYAIVPFPTVYPDEEQIKEISTLSADIDPYVVQMLARFVTGDADPEKDWDGYVNTLNKMNLGRWTDILTELYEKVK